MKNKLLIGLFLCLSATYIYAQETGQCGESLWYSYDTENHILTITGSGRMYDYESTPFRDFDIVLVQKKLTQKSIKNESVK